MSTFRYVSNRHLLYKFSKNSKFLKYHGLILNKQFGFVIFQSSIFPYFLPYRSILF